MQAAPSPQSIAKVLGGVVRGNSVHLPSAGHSAKDRGTVVTVEHGAPDGVLVHCFNDGDALAVKDRLREAGLLPALGNGRANKLPAPKWREVATYVYDDGCGEPVYRTKRLEADGHGKRFVAERYEDGKWSLGLGEVDRYPYRFGGICRALEAARAAGEPCPPVYFVEGERKADKLAGWDLIATAVAFGANGWRDEYGQCFEGLTVVILPDNDEPGYKFAETVKAGIEDYGGTAVILELPGLPPKGDVMDWDGTAGDLAALTAKALAGSTLPMRTLDLEALASVQPRAKVFAVERLAPLAEVTLFTGPGSAGKSLLGQQLATCAAASLPCLGLAVMPGAAIYMGCEDDEEQLHWRQAHLCESLGVPMASLAGRLHLVSLRGALDNDLCTFDSDGTLRPTPAFRRLVALVKATGARLVILDNVAHLFTGNENDRGEVTRFVNLLNRLAGETGAAVLLVGHPNKSGDSYSGSTAWLNAVRSQVFIDHDRDGEGGIIDHDARTLTVGKANYAQKGEALRFRWHEWTFILEDDLPSDVRAELDHTIRVSAENEAFMQCLAITADQHRAVSHVPGSNYAPAIFARMTEGKKFNRRAYVDALERLLSIGAIQLDQELWQGPNRHWKRGIKSAPTPPCANHAPSAPTP